MSRPHMVAVVMAGVVLVAAGCSESDADGRITATGTIECTEVNVATKVGGIIRSLDLSEGDRVDSGRVVALIDHSDLDWQEAQAEAGLHLARANLELALNGPQEEDIAQADAAVRQAEVQLAAARADLRRVEELARGGAATAKQLDDARTRVQTVESSLQMAEATHAKLRSGTRPEKIAAARAQVAQAEAMLGAIRQRIEDCTVTSPVRGTVTHRLAEPGEMAGPGAALVTISLLDRVWLKVYLPEIEIGLIRLGQPVDVYLDSAPEVPRRGGATYISPTAEFTPKNVQTKKDRVKLVFAVKIALDNSDGALKPGLPADAVFVGASPFDGQSESDRP